MEQLIIKALKSACGNRNIKFQIIIQDEQLHVYANHRQNYQPDPVVLQSNVAAAVASLALSEISSVWLYGRPLGQIEPSWQTLVELPTQGRNQAQDTHGRIENLDYLDSEIEIEGIDDLDFPSGITEDTGLQQETGIAQQNLLPESEIEIITEALTNEPELGKNFSNFTDFVGFDSEDSIGDTGLLQDTGLFHGSPLKETEIGTFAASPADLDADSDSELELEPNSLIQYCFVTNRQLLSDQVDSPGKDIMRMVKFVHHLSASDRHELLSLLDRYFREGITPGLDATLPAIQNWVGQIKSLGEEDQRLFFIWLSRYCFNPASTLEEFKTIAAQAAAEQNSKKSKSSTEYSFVTQNNQIQPLQPEALELNEPKFQLPSFISKILLPGIWTIATLILLGLGIISHNSQITIGSDQVPAICQNASGAAEYCRLAVNLAGAKTISQTPASLFPLTEVTETVANYGCSRYANLKAGIDIDKIAPETSPVIASQGEKIFPHIYVITAQQKKTQQPGNVRVGCVYTIGQGQRSPKKLAAAIIPTDWPSKHYQQEKRIGKNLAFGIYANPISLGLHTIFAALGIAIASWLNLGLQIERTRTVYLVALTLGMVQLVVASVPFLGLLEAIVLPMLTILAASFLLRDFHLNWQRGYPSVAISVLVIIAVQSLLYSFCLSLIGSLV